MFLIFHAALESGLYTYRYTHPISDTRLTEHKMTPTCQAPPVRCARAAGRERTDFCKMLKDPGTVASAAQQPEKAGGSPPPYLSRRAFHVRPNARSPGEQNSPFPFPWPPVRKGDVTQVSPPQVASSRHSTGPVGPASPASRAAVGPGRRPAAGTLPREPALEKPTPPRAAAANAARASLNPGVQPNSWSCLETCTSGGISAATALPRATAGLVEKAWRPRPESQLMHGSFAATFTRRA